MDASNLSAKDDIAKGDAGYRPIEDFKDWGRIQFDLARWNAHHELVAAQSNVDASRLSRAREVAKRSAAIDSGALEGLYDLDRGITITIATQSAMWEAAYQKEAVRTRNLIECQLDAYDFVIDFATGQTPIAEAWLRTLHERLCKAQETYKVFTEIGWQEQPLPHGVYKTSPNHVRRKDGTIHSYAPVLDTPSEMERLCAQMRGELFASAHPVLQAAYAHHALARIHPFQDGNGRVARALASVFLYRKASIPLLVLVEHRTEYLDALEAADSGTTKSFIDFVNARCIDAFLLINESLKTTLVPSPAEASTAIDKLLYTRGGFTHKEVELAGHELLRLFEEELRTQIPLFQKPDRLTLNTYRMGQGFPEAKPPYRNPVAIGHEMVGLTVQAATPSTQSLSLRFYFQVPFDCDLHDPIRIGCAETNLEFFTPFSNIFGKTKAVVRLQLAMFVEGVLGGIIGRLAALSAKELKDKGYVPK